MAISNTQTHYGSLAKSFHWLTVILIFSVIPLGIVAHGMSLEIKAGNTDADLVARTAWLFSLHKTIGVTIFFLALARIAWSLSQPKPLALNGDKKLEHTLAETVHWLLYGSLVLVPLTGWIHHSATSGFAPIWWPFGQSLPFVSEKQSTADLFAGLHVVFERVLVISLLLHIAGAVKHHVIDKDATLRRMLPGMTTLPNMPEQFKTKLPIFFAGGSWAAALFIGLSLGVYSSHSSADEPAASLEAVASEWAVESGAIEISVTQFGSAVTGGFADWTSAISFDASPTPGVKGSVETTINIASLTLGSVTGQAMGADFFDKDQFPTAIYSGELILNEDGTFQSDGTLTLKGISQPVSFPFELAIDGATATMSATLQLMRLDHQIGASMADESSLGFPVDINLNLVATKGE